MANNYYTKTGAPVAGSPGSSTVMQNEFTLLEQAFDKLPVTTGNNNEIVAVNSAGSGLESKSVAEVLALLSLVIGTDIQAWSAVLDELAATTPSTVGKNVLQAATEALARSAIGAAPLDNPTFTTAVTLPANGTSALHAVTKQQIDLLAPKASPALTGNPTAPTQTSTDNSTKLATTGFVQGHVATLEAAQVDKASQAEVDALTDDAKYVTPLKLGNGFSESSTTHWSITLPSFLGGYVLKFGTSATSAGGGLSKTFDTPFPTSCYGVVGVIVKSDGSPRGLNIGASDTTKFDAYTYVSTSGASTGESFFWLALGI